MHDILDALRELMAYTLNRYVTLAAHVAHGELIEADLHQLGILCSERLSLFQRLANMKPQNRETYVGKIFKATRIIFDSRNKYIRTHLGDREHP